MYEGRGINQVKFDDDGTIYVSDPDLIAAVGTVCRVAKSPKNWCRKWKMIINFTKT